MMQIWKSYFVQVSDTELEDSSSGLKCLNFQWGHSMMDTMFTHLFISLLIYLSLQFLSSIPFNKNGQELVPKDCIHD